MPEKLGNTFDGDLLLTPLTVGKQKGELGPDVRNNPVLKPPDPLGFAPSGSIKDGKKKGRK